MSRSRIMIKFWYILRFVLLLTLISTPQLAIVFVIKNKAPIWAAWLLFIFLYLVAIFFLIKTLKPLTKKIFKPLTKGQIKTVLLVFVAIYGLNIIYSLLSNNTETQNNQVISQLFSYSPTLKAMMACMTVLFAPLCEELLFRGILINSFSPKNYGWALFFSGFLFGLVHLNNSVIGFLLYMGIGWLLAYSYRRHNNLTVNWTIHLLINLLATLALLSI
jgi:membrane protease YdiL (CAAX protease family)